MTSAELIEKLKKLPPDAEIWVNVGEYGGHYFAPITAAVEKDENTIIIE